MFTQNEENYIKALINTYLARGYKYYLCHTVTENDNNYDVCIYFSKEEIKANSSIEFEVTNAICIYLDSSSRNDNNYIPSVHSRDIVAHSTYTSTVVINQAEFIYTNAEYSYSELTSPINPDILYQSSDSWTSNCYLVVHTILLVSIFLYLFFTNVLRLRR